jgi:uncharacterized repeat protein (TIGR04076 family)
MNISNAVWEKMKWKITKRRLGYNDDEMKKFRANPRNEDVLSKTPELMNKTIIMEVMESSGCNSQHKVGDKFYFDGAGNLLTKLCPETVCVYALNAVTSLIFASSELIFAGNDANNMRFKRAACFDVGVECGGWGRIVMEMRVENRKHVNIQSSKTENPSI